MKIKILILGLISFPSFPALAQWNGVPFVGDRAICQYITDIPTPEQQAVIDQTMASHGMRLYHWLWHTTRNNWQSLNSDQQNLFQALSPEWGRNQAVCPAPMGQTGTYAGEEFLRMHHMMIDELRAQLVAANQPCITGWQSIPFANDPTWPVPSGTSNDSSKDPRMERVIQTWAATFMDPNWLRSHSLTDVGYLLEFSIHNTMHARWSPAPGVFDNFNPLNENPTTVESLNAPSPYDIPSLNYLGNSYSAAVNPVFWKLHGWVDNVVVEWLRANGYDYISADCSSVQGRCYQWGSTWTGGMDHSRGEPVGGGHMDHMNQMSDVALDQALSPFVGQDSFRNPLFDELISQPRGGAGPGEATDFFEEILDPAVYVDRYNWVCRSSNQPQ